MTAGPWKLKTKNPTTLKLMLKHWQSQSNLYFEAPPAVGHPLGWVHGCPLETLSAVCTFLSWLGVLVLSGVFCVSSSFPCVLSIQKLLYKGAGCAVLTKIH